MSITFANAADRSQPLDTLRRLFIDYLFPGTTPAQRELILAHLEWMRTQTTPLNIRCKLETVPELHLTRLVLEYTQSPTQPRQRQ